MPAQVRAIRLCVCVCVCVGGGGGDVRAYEYVCVGACTETCDHVCVREVIHPC